MFDEKFWLAISFFAFVILVKKFVWSIFIKKIDQKSREIEQEILDAKNMKEKAKNLLNNAEKYYKESLDYADQIVKSAKDESEKLVEFSRQNIEEEIRKKTIAAENRIKSEEERIVHEIKAKTIMAALQVMQETITKTEDTKRDNHLLEKALTDFTKTVH
jgi:F0F1-type ATP synthase membrane subunit b/b'